MRVVASDEQLGLAARFEESNALLQLIHLGGHADQSLAQLDEGLRPMLIAPRQLSNDDLTSTRREGAACAPIAAPDHFAVQVHRPHSKRPKASRTPRKPPCILREKHVCALAVRGAR